MDNNNIFRRTYPIIGMTCAGCSSSLDRTLNLLEGMITASVNLASSTVLIEFDSNILSLDQIQEEVRRIGFDIIIETNTDNIEDITQKIEEEKYKTLKLKTIFAILLSLPIVIIGMFFMNMPYGNEIMWILSTPVVFWIGRDFFSKGWKAIRNGAATMDTLVALSTGIAYGFSVFNIFFSDYWTSKGLESHVYFEASSVIISFILIGRLLELRAKGNTQKSIKRLIGLQPKEVRVVDSKGIDKLKKIEDLVIGDVIIIRPGEGIAVDGIITKGSSYVDESMLSGEPMAISKSIGDKVFAGTINQKGSFYFRAEKLGSETLLSQIIEKVRQAQGSKAPVQKLVDRVASIFVPVIIIISIISLISWLVLDPISGLSHGLMAMVTVLIIACPCALGLATPTAIMVGIGRGADNGILIKDAESLEIGKKVNTIVLDKTGTITEGRPSLSDIIWQQEDEELKDILYNMEKHSEHPLAVSILEYFGNRNDLEIRDFENIPGKGIRARIGDEFYYVGNNVLLQDNDIEINDNMLSYSESWSLDSKTLVWFGNSSKALAIIGIRDKIKPSSYKAIQDLKSKEIELHILSGDNENTVRTISRTMGIENYRSGVLPGDKADYIRSLQLENKVVAMIGDGINDSAALAQADLSIAMGAGSDISIDVAQATIISSDLNKISSFLRLSYLTVRTIKQNLFWAFIYNIIGIPIAAGILFPINGFLLNPMIAGAAMALSSVSVVTNSLRLRTKKL